MPGKPLISCPLSSPEAGPSSQPLGASADSVLPRHSASQPGRRGGEPGWPSLPKALAALVLGLAEGIVLPSQTV